MDNYTKEEKMLVNIANIVLIAGLAVSIILLSFKSTHFYDTGREDINWEEIIRATIIGLSSITVWAVLKVIVGISVNIGKMANKQDKN